MRHNFSSPVCCSLVFIVKKIFWFLTGTSVACIIHRTFQNYFQKREFADGTVKLVYPDGTQETRYANGRIRLKDKNGKLIMDSDVKLT